MKNIFVRIFVFIVSIILLISSLDSLYTDTNFFLTKREIVAKVIKITSKNNNGNFEVTALYKNGFTNKEESAVVKLSNSNY
jgi:hypothetical protein